MEDGRVILTHGRSLLALAAAHSLGQRGLEVIGCDEMPMMALSFSRFVTETFVHTSRHDDEGQYLNDLTAGVARYRPRAGRPYVLMPIHRDTRLIARHRDRFADPVRVATPSPEAIDAVDPKDRLIESARRLEVPIPKTVLLTDRSALRQAMHELAFPVFLKVPDSHGGRGIEKVETPDSLPDAYDRLVAAGGRPGARAPLVQELAPGRDYCLTGLFVQGELRVCMAYVNLRTFPQDGGFGVLRETVEAGKLPALAERLMRPIGWNGVAEFDFRWDGTEAGEARLIEVNPRFWGGLFQSIESGVDYPWLLYELTVKGDVSEVPQARIGTRTKVPLLSLFSALQDISQSDQHLSTLRQAWHQSWAEMKDGAVWEGLKHFAHGVGDWINPKDDWHRLREALERSRDARPELFNAEDPFAALGLLYVLGSLLRTGRLPDEIRRQF